MKPTVLPVRPEAVPKDLRAIDRWVMWRYVEKRKADGTSVWAKVPMTTSGRAASSTNSATWTTFDDACDALLMGDFDGIGIVLADDLQGVDLDDHRDPDTGALSELAQELLNRVEGYAEVSPSGTGIKVFTKTNLDTSRTNKEAGVELYRDGRYFTVTGWALNGHACLPAETQDLGWLVERVWQEDLAPPAAEVAAADRALALYRAPLDGWDLDRVVQEVLPHLDPDCGYGEWLKVGAALHHQGQGDDEWLAAWDDWSAASGKYVAGDCETKWASFNAQRAKGTGVMTLATLLAQTREERGQAARVASRSALEDLEQAVASCDDVQDLQDQVAARVANSVGLSDVAREKLAAAIQRRAKDLGLRLPIATVRGWVRARGGSGAAAGGAPMPEWAKPWVYLTDGDRFFNIATQHEVSSQGFRAMHNRFMPLTQTGERERADQWALEQWMVPIVAHKAYLPSAGPVFEMFGRSWVNLFAPGSFPECPDGWAAEDQDAVDLVRQHLRTFFEDERDQHLFLSWVAHNVQHPGVKIRWAPYVFGVPGDGKSFWFDLLAAVLGPANVRTVLESAFTDWAVGSAVAAIEEVKLHGHNRHDVMNAVKPLITNDVISVHPKGRAAYTAPNTCNYLLLSNHSDGAPVDEADRRYMFLASRLSVSEAARMTEGGYFRRLFGTLRDRPGALRKWLLEVELHEEFDADGRAPMTQTKSQVIEQLKDDLTNDIADLIEDRADGITPEVISIGHLTAALRGLGHENLLGRRISNEMERAGFRFLARRRWDGERLRLWVRRDLNWSFDQAADYLQRAKGMDFLS